MLANRLAHQGYLVIAQYSAAAAALEVTTKWEGRTSTI